MPSGISCHSFSARKAAENSSLISFSFHHLHRHHRHHLPLLLCRNTFTSFLRLNGEISQQQSLSPFIKLAAKPSGVEEAQYMWQMNNPRPAQSPSWCRISNVHIIITAGDGSQGHVRAACAHRHMHTHTHRQVDSRTPIHIPYRDGNESVIDHQLCCSRPELTCPSSQNVTLTSG